MMSWPVDNATMLYWLLGGLAIVLLAGFWVTRKRFWLYGVGVIAVLVGLVVLLSSLIVTDRQQIAQSLQEIANNIQGRQPDKVFAQFSNEFRYRNQDKRTFEKRLQGVIRSGFVKECRISNVDVEDVSRANRTATVLFQAWGRGDVEAAYRCRATYVLDPDGQWRMQGFQLLDLLSGNEVPLPL